MAVAFLGVMATPNSAPHSLVHHLIVDRLVNADAYRLIAIDITKFLCAPTGGNAPDYCKDPVWVERFGASSSALKQPVNDIIAKLGSVAQSPGVVGALNARILEAEEKGDLYFNWVMATLAVVSLMAAELTRRRRRLASLA